jgi:tol-pal system protein YbgF
MMTGNDWGRLGRLATLGMAAALLGGCVTTAEFRKLEYEVNQMKSGRGGPQGVADVRSEVDGLREEVGTVQGRLEVVENRSKRALEEAQTARREVARVGVAPVDPEGGEAGPGGPPPPEGEAPPPASEELGAYREGYEAWRRDENALCIDRFGQFLQTFPSSQYADDAAFWRADCYYKEGDTKTAILRFDDVVSRYPGSDKAPEALYRQGEALMQLGPSYETAAAKVFQKVVKDYPDSRRARQAAEQLEELGAE